MEQIRNARNVIVPLHALPRQVERSFLQPKNEMSKSLSHTQYPNHVADDDGALFEPTFVKLDKQVSNSSNDISESKEPIGPNGNCAKLVASDEKFKFECALDQHHFSQLHLFKYIF